MAKHQLPDPGSAWLKPDGRPTETFFQRMTALFGSVNGLTATASYNPANLVDGAGVTTTVAVVNAAMGSFVAASFSLDLQGVMLSAWVSAAGTVSVRFQNETGGAIDLDAGTITVRVTT